MSGISRARALFLESVVWCRKFKIEFRDRSQCIKMTYGTDKASVMPAVAQRLEETVSRINLEVTAVAFGTKHLFIVCREKQTKQRGPIKTEWRKCLVRNEENETRKKCVIERKKKRDYIFSAVTCSVCDNRHRSRFLHGLPHYGKLKSGRLYIPVRKVSSLEHNPFKVLRLQLFYQH